MHARVVATLRRCFPPSLFHLTDRQTFLSVESPHESPATQSVAGPDSLHEHDEAECEGAGREEGDWYVVGGRSRIGTARE